MAGTLAPLSALVGVVRDPPLPPPVIPSSTDVSPRTVSGEGLAGTAGMPLTAVVASTVVRLGRAPDQRLTPAIGGNCSRIWRFCLSSATRVHSGWSVGGISAA